MGKWTTRLFAGAVTVIAVQLIVLDYRDLSWSNNAGGYFVILAMVAVIFSVILSRENDDSRDKQTPNSQDNS